MLVHIDRNIGVSGAKVHWMKAKQGKEMYWCRMAVAILGRFNMTDDEIATISPFSKEFHDNYVEGKGATKEEALENMRKDMSEISDSLWAE